MLLKNPQAIIRLLFLVALAACSPNALDAAPTQGSTSVVIPYQTLTPHVLSTEELGPVVDQPTATPATYIVEEGDTFFSIAATLGISLDSLIAANPGVDPRLLTPGTTLTLPLVGGGTATPKFPTPTPVPLDVSTTVCYTTTAGELWCFVSIQNTFTSPVENLAAVVQLFNVQGGPVATLEASPPINLLDAGSSMPLIAYSSDSPDGWVTARGQLLSAFALTQESGYYLPATIQQPNTDIAGDGLTANVTGNVEIQGGEAGTVWVLAVAYDADGEVVGVRRWESEGEIEFAFSVYSLGPEIAAVELLVEARP